MRLSSRCFALTGLAYVPPWSVNAGFVVGQDATLIVDTGANALAAATIHGYVTVVRPENRVVVLNTEKHFDHMGGNGYFRQREIDVYGHVSIRRTEDEFRCELAEFREGIANPARRARSEEAAFYYGTTLANPNLPIAADISLDLGDCTVEVILTPGHTPTNLSVYVPGDGVLFCGDCLANEYLPNLDCGNQLDWRQWLDSLDRIERLGPKVILPGHGPAAMGEDVRRVIETVRREVEQAIATGHSPTSSGAPADSE